MEAKIGRFFESVGTFFTGSDDLPWSDGEMIAVRFTFSLYRFMFCRRFGICWGIEVLCRHRRLELISIWIIRRGYMKYESLFHLFLSHAPLPVCILNSDYFTVHIREYLFFIYPQTCEKDAAESDSDRKMSENLLKLSWALVHSKRPHDVQRGIAMLEGIKIYMFIFWFFYPK